MRPTIVEWGLGAEHVDYRAAWQSQRELHADVVAGRQPPTVALLEHQHVYTAGTRTEPSDLPPPGEPVVRVDRGGRITWHGPGQVVAYPIVVLPTPVDVVAHVRRVESAVMLTCAELGLATERVDARSGVWVAGTNGAPSRKIAAVGIKVARGVTMHGVALNVDCDLAVFDRIVPCGIADAGVTSLAAEGIEGMSGPTSVRDVGRRLGEHLCDVLTWD